MSQVPPTQRSSNGIMGASTPINKSLPPPNWSPTGNSGWWVRNDADEKWQWVDDVYGEKSASEYKNEEVEKQKETKKWWEVWK